MGFMRWNSCFIALMFGSGCVSIGTHRRVVEQTKIETFQKARTIAKHDRCIEAMDTISRRIEKLGGE